MIDTSDIHNDLTSWRLFVRVCELASFSAVAKQFNVEPSTISRRIDLLEKKLGFSLFHRTRRRLFVTGAGLEVLSQIQSFLEHYDSLLSSMRPTDLNLQGMVTISAPASTVDYLLVHWLEDFQTLYPQIRWKLLSSDKALNPQIQGIDIAFKTGSHIGYLEETQSERIGMFSRALSASPSYLRRAGNPDSPEELARHKTLRYCGQMHEPILYLEQAGALVQLQFTPWLYSNSVTAIHQAALNGLGIQLSTPLYVCQKELDQGRLLKVLSGWEMPDLLVHAQVPKSAVKRSAVKATLEYIQNRWSCTPTLKA